jgi:hypothetical protein
VKKSGAKSTYPLLEKVEQNPLIHFWKKWSKKAPKERLQANPLFPKVEQKSSEGATASEATDKRSDFGFPFGSTFEKVD